MDEHANDTPWEPPFSGSEAEHLLGALDRLRWTFRYKADGLDAAGLDTRIGASSLTLGGLLKHLAVQEDYALVVKTDGEEMPAEWDGNRWDVDDDWEFSSAADDSPERLYATVRRGGRARPDAARRASSPGAASTSRSPSPTSWASPSACAGSSATSSRSTAGTPARPT